MTENHQLLLNNPTSLIPEEEEKYLQQYQHVLTSKLFWSGVGASLMMVIVGLVFVLLYSFKMKNAWTLPPV
jgi:ABC-type spermidine/putrescine transport system permease subunit I